MFKALTANIGDLGGVIKNIAIGVLLIALAISLLSIWAQSAKIETQAETIGKQEQTITTANENILAAESEKAKQDERHKLNIELIVDSWKRDRETRRTITVRQQAIRDTHNEGSKDIKDWGNSIIPGDYQRMLKQRDRLPDGTGLQ